MGPSRKVSTEPPFVAELELPKKPVATLQKRETPDVDLGRLNDQFIREGKLLSIDVTEKPETVNYRYKFSSYSIYQDWSRRANERNPGN